MKQCKKSIRRKKSTRTLADIRRIPKWARKKVGFTCEEVEFDYKLITRFIRLDTIQMRQSSFIPEINLNEVTPWVED